MDAEHEMPPLLEKVFRRNVQFVRVEEQSKVHSRRDDGTVYHHLMSSCRSTKMERKKEREGGRSESDKMVQTAHWSYNESKERRDRRQQRRREKGGNKVGKEEGKTN